MRRTSRTALPALLLVAQEGAAQSNAALHWVRLPGAESCADGQSLARAVETQLGRPVFASASRASLSIEATIAPRGDRVGWRVTLATRRGPLLVGAREIALDREACPAVTSAIVTVLSLIVDPDGCAGGACASAQGGAVAATPPSPPATPPPARPSRLTLLVGGSVAHWPSSVPSIVPSVAAGAAWRPWAAPITLEAGLSVTPPATSSLAGDGVVVRHTLALAAVSGCASPYANMRFVACFGVLAGGFVASAEGVEGAGDVVRPFVGLALRLGFEVPLGGPFVVRFVPLLIVPLLWPRYTITVREGAGSTEREVSPAGGFGGGLEVALGWRPGG